MGTLTLQQSLSERVGFGEVWNVPQWCSREQGVAPAGMQAAARGRS